MNKLNTPRILFIIALVVPFLFFSCQAVSADTVLKTVSPDDFFDTLEKRSAEGSTVILDVRTPGEFQAGHAPGAVNIDFYSPDFQQKLSELDKDSSYFIYCNSGNRSGQTLKPMEKLGFVEVYDLQGGWARNSARLLDLK